MAQVFISYSSKDRNVANMVCALLEERGHRCWIAPRDILPGREWGEAIIGGIRQAKIFVLIFSQHANTSPQILREVERAVNGGIPIIPFRIEDVLPQGSLEYFMSVPHWLDALSPPVEEHIERLSLAVEQLESGVDEPIAGGVVRRDGGRGPLLQRPTARAAIGGLALALLLGVAVLGGLGPPSAAVGGLGVLLALLVPGAVAAVGLGQPWQNRGLRIGLAAGTAALLALFLWATASYVIEGPRGDAYIRGGTCTSDAELVYEGQCPDLPADALADAEYRPELLWTSASIARAEQMIAGGWLGWLLLASILLGSYCVPQPLRPAQED